MKFGRRERIIALTVIISLAIVGLVVGLAVGLSIQPSESDPGANPPPVNSTDDVHYNSTYRKFRFAAVTSDTGVCSRIGVNILGAKGGSAVDAAIATMFCVGIVNAHSTGVGGGHFATIYDTPRVGDRKVLRTLLSRERAPSAAHQDLYVNLTTASSLGGLAIAVPGEVSGHYAAWQMFGRVPWSDLVMPSVQLCEDGFVVEKALSYQIQNTESTLRSDTNFAELFVKEDGSLIQEGELLKNPKLGATLRKIADDPMSYYNGSLAREIVDDIAEYGGNITLEDLQNYRSSFKDPVGVSLSNGDYTVYNPPPPSSGVVLDFIFSLLDGYQLSPSDVSDVTRRVLTYHRIAEAFKLAYAKRSELGDEDFVNVTELVHNLTSSEYGDEIRARIDDAKTHDVEYYEPTFDYKPDHGTTHLNVLAQDGAAVAMTGTINLIFGAKVRGRRTGIIFNNEMDDFSTPGTRNSFGVPASPSNYIEPGKMPMSSMSPSLVLDQNGNVVFMSGASGGTRITTQTAFVTMNALWFDKDLKNATDTPRIHHQLVPNTLRYESAIDKAVLDGLIAKSHETSLYEPMAVVGSVRSHCHKAASSSSRVTTSDVACIEAVSDGRKGGSPDGF